MLKDTHLPLTPNHLHSKDDIHISKYHGYNTQPRKTRLNRFCQFISTETWGVPMAMILNEIDQKRTRVN